MIRKEDFEYVRSHGLLQLSKKQWKSREEQIPENKEVKSMIVCGTPSSLSEMPCLKLKKKESWFILASLSEEQQRFVFHVLKLLSKNNGPFYFFLSGFSGAGKSYTLMAIEELASRLFKAPSGLSTVLLMSPSEETAAVINGKTLHECLAIPVSLSSIVELPKLSTETAEFLYSKLKDVKIVIIDQISSIGQHLISHINTRFKEIFGVSRDFADLSVILAGDLRQAADLDSAIFQNTQIWHKFQYYALKRSFRQNTDQKFARILRNFRRGKLSSKDLNLLNSRIRYGSVPKSPTFLLCSEESVDCFNKSFLEEFSTESSNSTAVDVISGPGNEEDVAKLQEYYECHPTPNIKGLRKKLLLNVSARYMIAHDIDASDGLVAGVIGLLQSVEHHNELVKTIFLLFDDSKTGAKAREKYWRGKVVSSQKRWTWVPIQMIDVTIPYDLHYNLTLKRSQFPVTPAEAVQLRSVHGRTLDKVCVYLEEKEMTSNLLYSAVSRVNSLRNLYIAGYMTKEHAMIDNVLSQEMLRLRNKAAIEFPRFRANPAENFSIYFHNIEDLAPDPAQKSKKSQSNATDSVDSKLRCMVCDPSIQEHDIVIFASPQLTIHNVTDLVTVYKKCGFTLLPSWESLKKSSILTLSKLPLCAISKKNYTEKHRSASISLIAFRLESLIIIIVNSSPYISKYTAKTTVRKFLEPLIKTYKIIVVGCLNFDLKEINENFSIFQKVLQTRTARNKRKALTSVIYTNFQDFNAQASSSLFTLHQPVCIQASRKLIESPVNTETLNKDVSPCLVRFNDSPFPPNKKTKKLNTVPVDLTKNSENEKLERLQAIPEIKEPPSVANSANVNKNKRKSCHVVRNDSLPDFDYLFEEQAEEVEEFEDESTESSDDCEAQEESDGGGLQMEVTEEQTVEETKMLVEESSDLGREETEAENSKEETKTPDAYLGFRTDLF